MFKRKLYDLLIDWKKSTINKTPLVIKGVTRCGKTTLVKYFGKENYKYVVYIDFKQDEKVKEIFNSYININDLILSLSSCNKDYNFIENETIVIFDNIEYNLNAISAAKIFMETLSIDVVITTSMDIKKYTDFDIVNLYPLDFEEFLFAHDNHDELADYIKTCVLNNEKINETLHKKLTKLFSIYICVGGFPEALLEYFKTHHLNNVRSIQEKIINSIIDSFGKTIKNNNTLYIDNTKKERMKEIFLSINNQLLKDNKKFLYTLLKQKASSREYKESLDELESINVIIKSHNMNTINTPLSKNIIDSVFKIYILDIGLFVSMQDLEISHRILNKEYNICNNALYESIIADAFIKNSRPLYYFKKQSGLEIDFVIFYNGSIKLVELRKTTGNTKAYKQILEDNINYSNVNHLIKFQDENISISNNTYIYPYYLASFIY